MRITVWVDAWQMQCCGGPFAVGGEVRWTVVDPDPEWLSDLLGPEEAAGVDAAEEHHGDRSQRATPRTGTVTGISAVHCRYAPPPDGDAPVLHPVAGSATRTALPSADGWTPDEGDRRFVGYLVRLALDGT